MEYAPKKLTLKQHRVLAEMTQEQLAEAVGVERGTIAIWECGKLPRTFYYIARLEEIFGIRLADDFKMPKA